MMMFCKFRTSSCQLKPLKKLAGRDYGDQSNTVLNNSIINFFVQI
jgi:hypothetical protein